MATNARLTLLTRPSDARWFLPVAFICAGLAGQFLIKRLASDQLADFGVVVFVVFGAAVSLWAKRLITRAETLARQNERELTLLEAEQRTHEAALQIADVLESMTDAYFSVDRNWKLTRVNATYERLGGIRRAERLGTDFRQILIERDMQDSKYWTEYHRVMNERIAVRFDGYDPGQKLWTECRAFPTSNGGMAVFFSDVTEKVNSRLEVEQAKSAILIEREALARSEQRALSALAEAERAREELYAFFMQAPAPMVILTGPEHKFVLANSLYEQYVGREVTGKTLLEAFNEEEVRLYLPLLDGVYQSGIPYVGRGLPLSLNNHSDPSRPARINVSYTPFHDSNGAVKGILGFIQDVTEEYNARAKIQVHARELQCAKEEAERANKLKSAFLANMSHELRTPLGALIGFADLLRDPSLSREEHDNYVNIITRNGEQLSEIINDILDLSKVEAGHLTLEHTLVNPGDIAKDVVSLLKVKAAEKALSLELAREESTPEQIVTDPLRFRQILLNIVGNAIKFTQTGSVTVRTYGARDSTRGTTLYIEVTDTGIGISELAREKIFSAFVQADGTLARKFGGTGLGLALSRLLARKLGGDITISASAEGQGSTFLISVQDQPAAKITQRPTRQIQASNPNFTLPPLALANTKVLVVDDSADNRELIRRLLQKSAATVEFAENGLLGYRKALFGDFDIVLMDIQMPEMDGYTATQKLREAGYQKPIIALTAHAMTEARMKCLNVGCTAHLSKPIKPPDLISTVAKYTTPLAPIH